MYRDLSPAMDVLRAGPIAPHRHRDGYAAIVRAGRYSEAALEGRFEVRTAMIVIHPPLQLHTNAIEDEGCAWNVPIAGSGMPAWAAFSGRGAERLARQDRPPTSEEVCEALSTCSPVDPVPMPDWLADLVSLDFRRFDEAQAEVSREHAHRVFKAHFGISPGRWRREKQLQHAVKRLNDGAALADIASEAGFADQSHMSRVCRRELGTTPARLRAGR